MKKTAIPSATKEQHCQDHMDLLMVEFDDNLTINPYSALPIEGDNYDKPIFLLNFYRVTKARKSLKIIQ